jgi:hypothetical protein
MVVQLRLASRYGMKCYGMKGKVGTLDTRLDAIMIDLDTFHPIIGQPWLQAVSPDKDWSTKAIRDRKTREAMVYGDEYTVPMAVHILEAVAIAKLLRQQLANLFVTGLHYEKYMTRSTTSIPINIPSGRLCCEISRMSLRTS